jgi:hypothetical protein
VIEYGFYFERRPTLPHGDRRFALRYQVLRAMAVKSKYSNMLKP